MIKLLLVGAVTYVKGKYDDFSEIPLKNSAETNEDIKPIIIPLQSDKTYIDHIKDHLYKVHSKV